VPRFLMSFDYIHEPGQRLGPQSFRLRSLNRRRRKKRNPEKIDISPPPPFLLFECVNKGRRSPQKTTKVQAGTEISRAPIGARTFASRPLIFAPLRGQRIDCPGPPAPGAAIHKASSRNCAGTAIWSPVTRHRFCPETGTPTTDNGCRWWRNGLRVTTGTVGRVATRASDAACPTPQISCPRLTRFLHATVQE
jgi:hypothetical protein